MKETQTLPEEALDKMIELIEGPINTVAEKVLSSTLVLAPLSLSMNLTFRAMALLAGRKENKQ